VAKENHRVAVISLRDPAFNPEHAMTVWVESKTANRVVELKYMVQ